MELQNKGLLASPDNLDGLDDSNLCYMVAKLSSLAKYDKLVEEEDEGKKEDFDGGGDEGSSGLGDSEEDDYEDLDDDLDDSEDEMDDAEEEDAEEEDSEDDLLVKPEDIEKTGLNLNFDMDTDDEPDNFDDLIAPEGKETDDEEEEKNDREEDGPQSESDDDSRIPKERSDSKQPVKPSKFGKSNVDSKFFNLRESEWIADNDILGQNFDGKDDDVDYMEEISDDEDEVNFDYICFLDISVYLCM